MKKIKFALPIFLALVICASLVTAICSVSVMADSIDDQKRELSSMQDSYSKAVANTQELKNKIASKTAQIKNKQDEKNVLDEEITVLTEQVMKAEALIEEYSLYIEETEKKKEELQKKYDEQDEMLGNMLRMSYKYGDESYIDIILGADSITDFLQRLDFLAYHMKYSSTLLAEIKETSDNLSEISENLTGALEAMTSVKEETETAKAELEEKLARVDVLIVELQRDTTNYKNELAQKEADRKALEADIKALSAKIAAQEAKNGTGSKPAYSGGKLGWPLLGIPASRKTSSYGYRTDPITGQKGAFHNGMDVGAPYGTKILAAESGTVVRSSWYSSYGNCVIIDHGNGLMTLYAHCSGYNVKVGDIVSRGDVIAFVGSTGRSTGNHLHFTVFVNGSTVNPLNYLE